MLQSGQRVSVHYVGTLDDGTEFGSTYRDGAPFEFTVGTEQVLPDLEKTICQMECGERRTVHILAANAYGAYDENLVIHVPTENLPGVEHLSAGKSITVSTDAGEMRVKVLKVEDDTVWLDCNHELAGKNLNYSVELISIEGEHEDNLEQEGHHHGCGCDILRESLES